MDRATGETVLGDFNNAELTHLGITSRMFRRDGQFFVNTEGPDGMLADFEVKYVLGVTPLQQYMVEFDRPADMPAEEVARSAPSTTPCARRVAPMAVEAPGSTTVLLATRSCSSSAETTVTAGRPSGSSIGRSAAGRSEHQLHRGPCIGCRN